MNAWKVNYKKHGIFSKCIVTAPNAASIEKYFSRYEWHKVSEASPAELDEDFKKGIPVFQIDNN